ncbi:Thymidylate kinase [Halioglobus japonicus]|nr:Thymidylate kinase [Halioglobus japonicus]
MSGENDTLPPLIAIIGCDGSGKSTVSEELLAWTKGFGPAAAAHLGKQQGNSGRWFANLPLVGGWFEKFIGRKAATVHSSRGKNKAPDLLPALVMHAFTLRRIRRFRRMMKLRQQGLIIIADRFPQLDFPSAFDGPDMSVDANGSRFVQWLARREQRAFEWMTSYRPDLALRLNVDLDTACARKPDHRREALKRKIEITPRLTLNGAKIVEIDAAQPLDKVLAVAKSAVQSMLVERGYHRTEP